MSTLSDDYHHLLLALLPSGAAWPRESDTVLSRLLAGLADGLGRGHERGEHLLDEADPRTTVEMLGDWETVAGLPDACSGAGETTQERQAALVARITARGGQSVAYFAALASLLGYGVTVDEYRPFIAGASRCGGDALNGPAAVRHEWRVRVAGPRVTEFRGGVSRCGERLGSIARAADLECLLRRLAPAHTHLIFAYEGA